MPDLIVLRLHPEKPTSAVEFATYLDKLKIEAFDLSVSHPAGERPAGTQPDGEKVGEVKNPPDAGAQTQIVQHGLDISVGLVTVTLPGAAATAVIELTPPSNDAENP